MYWVVAKAMCWVGGIETKPETKCLDLGCGKNFHYLQSSLFLVQVCALKLSLCP